MCASQYIPVRMGIKKRMEEEPLQMISKQCYVISDNHREEGGKMRDKQTLGVKTFTKAVPSPSLTFQKLPVIGT